MHDGYKEYLTEAQARLRIAGIGAKYLPDYSNQYQTVYYSDALSFYVRLTRKNDMLVLEYMKECDCNG